jgi:hypothetical protein
VYGIHSLLGYRCPCHVLNCLGRPPPLLLLPSNQLRKLKRGMASDELHQVGVDELAAAPGRCLKRVVTVVGLCLGLNSLPRIGWSLRLAWWKRYRPTALAGLG